MIRAAAAALAAAPLLSAAAPDPATAPLAVPTSGGAGSARASVCCAGPDLSPTQPDPRTLQARYDSARDRQERALAAGDRAGAARALAEIRWAEGYDSRPPSWRATREVPELAVPALARAERATDRRLAARLQAIGRGYRGWAGFWVHDLATGATAGWNADASFPAASTVKLGVLAAALRRYGPRPERSSVWYDLRQLTGWSSNLAANRLVRKIGGEQVVADALRRLGARSSTYPGPYRAGTAVPADAPKPPPVSHWRVTTAHDLGRILYAFQAAAAGNRYVRRLSGMTRRQARLGLALLASSSSAGENAGLLRPYVRGATVAHKVGWISDLRATAAVVYRPERPIIAVVLAYRPGIGVAEARVLGRQVARLLSP
jgi:beta-lactamase class A